MNEMSNALIQVQGLNSFYGASHILRNIDFKVNRGETIGLMGRNGMGKTTTIRSIMGLTAPRRGRVRINGNEVQGQPAFRIARAGVALVPEGRQVFLRLTVREHLEMAQAKRNALAETWNIAKVFELFPRLGERRDHLGGQLSGGEQQMLAIGRALVTNPEIILFDEATEGLAPLVQREIWMSLRQLKALGYALLVVDKNLFDVASLADRMVVLEKGRVVWAGSSDALRADAVLQNRYLGV
jgi:branched-chain amino acid transport system ATP-binding protein